MSQTQTVPIVSTNSGKRNYLSYFLRQPMKMFLIFIFALRGCLIPFLQFELTGNTMRFGKHVKHCALLRVFENI